MAFDSQASTLMRRRSRAGRVLGGGTTGNERLTAVTGAVLIVLLAVIGVTILRLGQLLWIHLFVGMLLIGPLALKLASTGYRFARYYTSNPRYRRKGPPALPLRLIAPVVIISTVVVFASGVVLLFAGPSAREQLLPIHKVSFFVWIAFTAVHVLAHLPTVQRALLTDYGRRGDESGVRLRSTSSGDGRAGRAISLAGALTFGVVLAIVVIPQFAPWLNAQNLQH